EDFNATFAASMARRGHVAFLSQSGALCTAILDWSLRENIGFSAFVSVGSMADVSWGDLFTHFGEDPNTRSIVCYMESVGNARAFLSAAREVARDKPIIVIKVGHTEAAARVAASHTGSLTGSDAVLDAAFRRAGVLRVDTVPELFAMAEALGKQPRPRGPNLAIVTNAGGPGALATDMLIGSGGALAELSAQSLEALNSFLPPHWSHNNPVDILGDADASRYARAVEIALRDPGNDGVLVVLTPQAMTQATETARELCRVSTGSSKPILASWMGADAIQGGQALLNDAGIPTFDSPDVAARAFALMWRHSQSVKSLYETPLHADEALTPGGRARVEEILSTARSEGRTLLSEAESKQLLAAHGIPVVQTETAFSEDEAAARARSIGFPVVLKLFSKTLTHKTDVGGVELDLKDEAAVRAAWRAIQSSVAAKAGAQHFLGVTVQPMIPRSGYELILGSSIDPQFGPVVLFGSGGQLVEVFKDRALGLPPLNGTLAARLMEQTRIHKALLGVRGRKGVDMEKLAGILVRFSHLVLDQPRIAEIDINPLVVSHDRILALDARVVLVPHATPAESLPRPAIRPYPAQYTWKWELPNGASVTLRPIRPEDEPAMTRFHASLSEESVYFRYFSPLRFDQRIAHERLSRLCFIDYDRQVALVAEKVNPENGVEEILGVGRLSDLRVESGAEFALLVSDEWQGKGLGTELLRRLISIGMAEGVTTIRGRILPENRAMVRLCAKLGFEIEMPPGAGEWQGVWKATR
ncbi:MAG TPA: acetyl CoA synthetase subunit alpha, partial [Verrucomicrobiales bacterium]|nr:acetyl CoA synthetase subunit alpha [Verrucomicrobiales bacterium]